MNNTVGVGMLLASVAMGSAAHAQNDFGRSAAPSSDNQTAARASHPGVSATSAPTQQAQLRAQMSELEAVRVATGRRLQQAQDAQTAAATSLNRAKLRVQRGQLPQSALPPLQKRLSEQQGLTGLLRSQLREIEGRQARMEAARTSPRPGGVVLESGQQAGAEDRERLNERIRALVAAGAAPTSALDQPLANYSASGAGVQFLGSNPPLQSMAATARNHLDEATAQQSAAAVKLKVAETTYEQTKRMVAAGLASNDAVAQAEAQVAQAQAEFQRTRNDVEVRTREEHRLSRLVALQRPIDVELRDAPVRQAAQTIAQASGVPVEVDAQVPTQTRLTVVARGVGLATVLDTIARQSGLLITPGTGDQGILLKPAPTLEVNGQRTDIMTPFAPWSSEWGMNPANSLGYSAYRVYRDGLPYYGVRVRQVGSDGTVLSVPTDPSRETPTAVPVAPGSAAAGNPNLLQGQPGGKGTLSPTPAAPGSVTPSTSEVSPTPALQPGAIPFAPGSKSPALAVPPTAETVPGEWFPGSTAPYLPRGGPAFDGLGAAGGAPLVITALNDSTFVVAHPTVGPGGEPAVMLTVYRLQGTQLRVVSTALHRLGSGGAPRRSEGYFPVVPAPRQSRPEGTENAPDALPTPAAPGSGSTPRAGERGSSESAPSAPAAP